MAADVFKSRRNNAYKLSANTNNSIERRRNSQFSAEENNWWLKVDYLTEDLPCHPDFLTSHFDNYRKRYHQQLQSRETTTALETAEKKPEQRVKPL